MKKTLFWTLLAAAFLVCMSCDTGSSSKDDPATTDQTTTDTSTDTSTGTTTDTATGTTTDTTTGTTTDTATGTTTDTSTGTTTDTTTGTTTDTTTGTTGETTTVTTFDCLKVAGKSAEAYGAIGIATQFSLASATDFTGGDYTVTFDVYVPSSSAAISKFQLVLPNSSYSPMYFDVSAVETGKWVPVTLAMTSANVVYGALLADSNCFRIYALTAATGSSLEFSVKNIKITNGTATPLEVTVTSTSDYTGNYNPLGTGVTVTTSKI